MRWSVLAVLLAAPVLGAAQAPPCRGERAVRGGVLLQDALGLRRRVHPALQEEPLPGVKAGDRAGAHPAGHRGGAPIPRDRGWPLGLSRHDRVEERRGAARAVPRGGAETSVSRPGHVSARGAAALRDPRGALGPARGQRGSDAAVARRLDARGAPRHDWAACRGRPSSCSSPSYSHRPVRWWASRVSPTWSIPPAYSSRPTISTPPRPCCSLLSIPRLPLRPPTATTHSCGTGSSNSSAATRTSPAPRSGRRWLLTQA